MRLITTKARGWQKHAWELAKTGRAFEIIVVNSRHILFIQELCAAYKCRVRKIGDKLQLFFQAHSEA